MPQSGLWRKMSRFRMVLKPRRKFENEIGLVGPGESERDAAERGMKSRREIALIRSSRPFAPL
jgi:hypothetical protein